jgi:hypothetical protein
MTAIAATLVACGDRSTEPSIPAGSFAQLNAAVFAPTCATSGCHVASSAALAGNLALDGESVYGRLVGAVPTNLNAKNDGLRLVVKFQPDSSLLYQKIVMASNAHSGAYGGTMPVGKQPLSVGQLEFIRKWIEAGAPEAGYVADSMLLVDATPQADGFAPLTPPEPGTGYQVKMDAFTVRPEFERELFTFRPLGNTSKIYVTRIRTSMRALSHHFLLYTMDGQSNFPGCAPAPNITRDIRNPDGTMNFVAMLPMACHVFFGGSMVQQSDYLFPPGVGLELPANAALDLNVHYVNYTGANVPGEAYANLYTTPAASVEKVAHTLNLSNMDFAIPPKSDYTATKVFTMTKTTTIFALTSHMHARGTRFEIQIVGGARNNESVYVNTDWEHPQLVTFSTPIVLQPGQGLRSVVTWHNESNATLTFGLKSTDEMAIIFGYYY